MQGHLGRHVTKLQHKIAVRKLTKRCQGSLWQSLTSFVQYSFHAFFLRLKWPDGQCAKIIELENSTKMFKKLTQTWSMLRLPLWILGWPTANFWASSLMSQAAALGTTVTVACLLTTVNLTVTFWPFQSPVAFLMSSPTFFGDCNVTRVVTWINHAACANSADA